MDIGKQIKKFRKNLGLKQSDLAEKLHVTSQAVSSWETNRTQPKMDMIEEMCKIFHCKKSDFLADGYVFRETPDARVYIGPARHRDSISLEESQPINFTDEEIYLIKGFRNLDDNNKEFIKRLIRIMSYIDSLNNLSF